MDYLSLNELGGIIKKALDTNLEPTYWVVGEIGEIRLNRNGHCYMDLIEKTDDNLSAKFRATIWSYSYRKISGWFEAITGSSLQPGMQILAQVEVSFHEAYGMSLNIKDIDPNFTLGERARRRQEIMQQLEEEGVIEMNKALPLPLVPQRVAVISSATAAGFGDFMDHIKTNPYHYAFQIKLFQSAMQGREAEKSIIESMYQINEDMENGIAYDVLVIIRGGGAQVDLDCFDTYDIATHIAQFPIPVITGIGHERDETIADWVAHTRMKTPTAVAEFLINGLRSFEELIDIQFEKITRASNEKLHEEQYRLQALQQRLQYLSSQQVYQAREKVNQLKERTKHGYRIQLKSSNERLKLMEEKVKKIPKQMLEGQKKVLGNLEKQLNLLNPENILKRGYSISMVNGQPIQNRQDVKPGERLTTRTFKRIIESQITDVQRLDE